MDDGQVVELRLTGCS